MRSITAICGALLGFTLLLHLQPSGALRCYSCAHIKANKKLIGDGACLQGASKYLVECSEQTEILSPSEPGKRITLGDLRRQLGEAEGNDDKIYSCAATTVNTKILGVTINYLTRQCYLGNPGKRSECKSGTKQEFDNVDKKNLPTGTFAGLKNDARVKVCTCYADQCTPSEIGGGGLTGRSGGGGGSG